MVTKVIVTVQVEVQVSSKHADRTGWAAKYVREALEAKNRIAPIREVQAHEVPATT
jgi:hypothetical protein